jgi:toxin FitB
MTCLAVPLGTTNSLMRTHQDAKPRCGILMYLVDTNIVSEARRGMSQAVSWLRSVDPLIIHLSALTLGQILRGIALKQRSDPKSAAHLTEWLRKLRHDHGDRILPITDQIAVEWGRIAAIRPRGDIDGLIAATAIVHDLILVTRNVKDFEDTDASVINPWETSA